MLGLESSVKWRGTDKVRATLLALPLSLRPLPTGARAATGSHRGHSDRPARPEQGQPPGTSSRWPAGEPACSRPIGPLGGHCCIWPKGGAGE